MHQLSPTDHGQKIDWSKSAHDYARYRPGYPKSFYDKISDLKIVTEGSKVLDLGTGTGIIARHFSSIGCQVFASDVSEGQIEMAKALATEKNLSIHFQVSKAEDLEFSNESFDLITASQCFIYFDKSIIIPLIKKWLKPTGLFMTSHLCWLPLIDPIAQETEKLILQYNPKWTAHSFKGGDISIPPSCANDFQVKYSLCYNEKIPFTEETWRGRIRACRAIGATLSPEEVTKFDDEHKRLLKQIAPEANFSILHQIDAHMMAPK